MKKLIVFLLVFALIFTLTACRSETVEAHDHDHDHEHAESVENPNGEYVTPETLGDYTSYVGEFHLDYSYWSEESIHELLGSENEHNFLSIAPDGTAYLGIGGEITEGTALVYSDIEHIPNDMPHYKLTFDGVTYDANILHPVITVDEMPEYSVPSGMTGSSWMFVLQSGDTSAEETVHDHNH